MSVLPVEIAPEVIDAAKAIGLMDAGGGLRASWFQAPLDALSTVLSDADQRDALVRLIGALLGAREGVPGAAPGETFHPLLAGGRPGNVYLTTRVDPTSGKLTIGVAGEIAGSGAAPSAALRVRLPILESDAGGGGLRAVAGTADGPIEVSARLTLGWQTPGDDLTLAAVRVAASAAPFAGGGPLAGASLSVTLEGLDLDDGGGARDVTLDPRGLGPEAGRVLLALLRHRAAGAGGAVAHLLPLFGIGAPAGERIPPFPITEVGAGDLNALRRWVLALWDDGAGPPPICAWLDHLAGAVGGAGLAEPDPDGGGGGDAWRVRLVDLGAPGGGLELTVDRQVAPDSATPLLVVGLRASLLPPGADPAARIEARATLVKVPLGGTGAAAAAAVLPDASVTLVAPGGSAARLVDTAAVSARALAAGARWDGARLRPVVQLDDVTLAGTHYDRIDLLDAGSVEAAAAAAVAAAIEAALGVGVGAHLAALVGLRAPAGAGPGWPHLVDVARLVSDPAAAIATVHRGALAAGAWDLLFGELAALVGLGGTVIGNGVERDPWRVTLASTELLAVELAAWRADAPGGGGDPGTERLRIGLRAGVGAAAEPWRASWLAELLAFDLPAAGRGRVSLLAGHHVALALSPAPSVPEVAGVAFSADALGVGFDWVHGAPLAAGAELANLAVTIDGTTTTVGNVRFPPGPGGLGGSGLGAIVRALVARAALSWGGMDGYVVAGLIGLHVLPGSPADWPRLGDGSPALLDDPIGALRVWLGRILTGVSADGTPFLPVLSRWVVALAARALPAAPGELPPEIPAVAGAGTDGDPWALPVGTEAIELLAWLEPEGPPPSWSARAAAALGGAATFAEWVQALDGAAPFVPAVRDALALAGDDPVGGLEALSRHLATTDGVVPLASQLPQAAAWRRGATAIAAAHPLQPSDPAAIAQVLAEVDALAAGGDRAVLLLGPAFSDHTAWDDLLAAAEAAAPGSTAPGAAHFDFRQPGVDPGAIDLGGVAAASFYTANLADDGSGPAALASLRLQIDRATSRIAELGPPVPVTIVAHSTAGVVARLFAAANPARVRGLVTLGTPHTGAPLGPLTDARAAGALRMLAHLFPAGFATGPIGDAAAHLLGALDGYRPAAAAGGLPVAAPYPFASFAGSAGVDAPGVPALALGGALGAGVEGGIDDAVLAAVAAAAAALVTDAAAATPIRPDATHLGVGARVHLPLPDPAGGPRVDVSLRLGDLRLPLAPGLPEPPRPARRLALRIRVDRPAAGWLVGSAGGAIASDAGPEVRVGALELGLDVTFDGGGGSGTAAAFTPHLRLVGVAFHSPTVREVSLDEPVAPALLGAVAAELVAAPGPSAAATLLAVLEALDLVVRDGGGAIAGFSADALDALRGDPAGFLGPRLPAALDAAGAAIGLGGPAGGPWTLALADAPFELVLSAGPPFTVRLRTAEEGATLGLVRLAVDARLAPAAGTTALDARVAAGALALARVQAAGTLVLEGAPFIAPLTLIPAANAAAVSAALERAVPRLVLAAVASGLIETVVGPGFQIGPLVKLLESPSRPFLQGGGSGGAGAGAGASAGVIDPAAVARLIDTIARGLGGAPGGPLVLPLGLELAAVPDAATGSVTVTLSTPPATPIAGVVAVALAVTIDPQRAITVSGSLALTLPTGTEVWPSLEIRFGVDPAGVSLVLTPLGTTAPGASAPIQILPAFGGLGALAGAAAALLPAALDKLVAALPPSPLLTAALDIAAALGVYDAAGGFAAHTDTLRAMAGGDFLTTFSGAGRADVAARVAALFAGGGPLGDLLPAGATVSASPAGAAVLTVPLAAPAHGAVSATLGWDAGGPALSLGVAGVSLDGGLVTLDARAGLAGGAVESAVAVGFDLAAAGLALPVAPRLVAAADAVGGFSLALLPLGAAPAATSPFDPTGPVVVALAPTPGLTVQPGAPAELVRRLVLPLARDLALGAFAARLGEPLWTGGPTAAALLEAAGLTDGGGAPLPPPEPEAMLLGLFEGLADNTEIVVSPTLRLKLCDDGGRLGVRLQGWETLGGGAAAGLQARLLIGEPATFIQDADRGVTVYLADVSGAPRFRPALHVVGLGAGLGRADGRPLIDTAPLRLGTADGYLFFDAELSSDTPGGGDSTISVTGFGAGVELGAVGLPLGAAASPGANPVASSLLTSQGGEGGGGGGGDTRPVSPPLTLAVFSRDGTLDAQFEGEAGPVRLGVHATFGPLYIDQIGIGLRDDDGDASDPRLEVLVDGGVRVAGLNVQVDDLGVIIPLRRALDPGAWGLDLRGLAVAFDGGGVTIAGGLTKNPGPPITYDGMMIMSHGGRTVTAVGSYARPGDAAGAFTSLFVFASLSTTIGGPPFLYITGLGAGAGYNRTLVPPASLNDVPRFPLITAIDDASLASDPMGALTKFGAAMPPKRGSVWLAAGIRFTSYVIVHSVAVAYVLLDRSIEITLLGRSRMELPTGSNALVNVELALAARFSAADGTLSVRAQLTDNSWLLSRDCQLTGGFAFFIWFREAQFVLTLGGYHPAFQKPERFPDVPRLGFHWSFSPQVVLKGEAYFALTNSCVMAGGRLEVSYHRGSIRAWFIAQANFLVSWDPFHYDIDISVEVGASFRMRVCFFGCVTFNVSVSLGASLSLTGPPLRGEVTVELAVASVTVAFGAGGSSQPPYLHSFDGQFAPKYLVGSDPEKSWVSLAVARGLLPPDPPGAAPAPGTAAAPWRVTSEFDMTTETRMPARSFHTFLMGALQPLPVVGAASVDLAPMNKVAVGSVHKIAIQRPDGTAVTPRPGTITVQPVLGLFPEATWHFVSPEDQRAAANTIRAVSGFKLSAVAVLEGKSAQIPIATLVDDMRRFALPLPFAAFDDATVVTGLKELGAAADALAQLAADAERAGAPTIAIAQAMLSQAAGGAGAASGVFAESRRRLGAPGAGLPARALRSLATERSSPPLIAPVASGLTLAAVGLAPAPVVARPPADAPVVLAAPRLRAVLRAPNTPAIDAPVAGRTSVTTVARPTDPRRAPPAAVAAVGARLHKLAPTRARVPTAAAAPARTLRHPELGGSLGKAHVGEIAAAEKQIGGNGVAIAAGVTQVWDLPSSSSSSSSSSPPSGAAAGAAAGRTVVLGGQGAAARVTFLDRAGRVLDDRELVPGVAEELALPPGATVMAVGCLGVPQSAQRPAAGLGAISRLVAPPAAQAVTGWQAGNRLPLVGGSTLLGRGATVSLARAHAAAHGRQRIAQAMVTVAEAAAEQAAIETSLPIETEVVMLLIEQRDPTRAAAGDLALSVEGARLATPPARAAGGRTRVLFYDVAARDAGRTRVVVSVASREGWRLTGCVGLAGRAAEWAARFAGGVPEHFVPDAPLSPDGVVTVRLETGGIR